MMVIDNGTYQESQLIVPEKLYLGLPTLCSQKSAYISINEKFVCILHIE